MTSTVERWRETLLGLEEKKSEAWPQGRLGSSQLLPWYFFGPFGCTCAGGRGGCVVEKFLKKGAAALIHHLFLTFMRNNYKSADRG